MMTSSQKPKNHISIFDPCQMYKKTAKFGGVWANTSEDRGVGKFTHSPPQPTYMPDAPQDRVNDVLG